MSNERDKFGEGLRLHLQWSSSLLANDGVVVMITHPWFNCFWRCLNF